MIILTNTTGNTIISTTAAKKLNELTDVKFDDTVDFNNSLLIGHTTTGTLSAAENNKLTNLKRIHKDFLNP